MTSNSGVKRQMPWKSEWPLATREPFILDSNLGSNIIEVEELIKQQQDFEGDKARLKK